MSQEGEVLPTALAQPPPVPTNCALTPCACMPICPHAASPLPLDLVGAGVLEPCLAELTTFLRKALRPLRLAALVSLEVS